MNLTTHEQDLLKQAMIRRAMGWPAKPSGSPYAAESLIEQDLDRVLAKADEATRRKWLDQFREIYLLELGKPIAHEANRFVYSYIAQNERNPTRAELDAHMHRCFPRTWRRTRTQ